LNKEEKVYSAPPGTVTTYGLKALVFDFMIRATIYELSHNFGMALPGSDMESGVTMCRRWMIQSRTDLKPTRQQPASRVLSISRPCKPLRTLTES